MKTVEETQAAELDRCLDALQAGLSMPPHPSLPSRDAEMLASLVNLQQASQPNPVFGDGLQKRLQNIASVLKRGRKSGPGFLNKPGLSFALGGAVMVALVILVIVLINQNQGSLPIALQSTQTPTPQATPLPSTPTPQPVAPTPTGPVSTASGPTSVPPTPTLALPTSAPALPILSAWLGIGYGGGGSSPDRFQFDLGISLSGDSGQATAYLQRQSVPFDVQQAAKLAAGLGFDQPRWYDNVAIDDPRQIVFGEDGSFDYVDHSVFNFPAGRYDYPPDAYPPADLAAQAAQAFLERAGLLDEPYTFTVRGENVFFDRLLDGQQTVYDSFALVSVSPDGRVGMAHYSRPALDAVGSYPLISTEQAWQILAGAQTNPDDASRIFIRVLSTSNGNPHIWTRSYQAGQQANLYTSLEVLQPSEAGQPPYIRTSNGLVVQAELASLQSLSQDYRTLVESSLDQAAAIHVWGTIRDETGYQVLELAGWDSQSYDRLWQGTLERQAGGSVLHLSDGSIIPLVGPTVDVPDGQQVFVDGFLSEGSLEWTVIQAYVESLPPGSGLPQPILISKVELAYLAPQGTQVPQTLEESQVLRTLQPVWCFSGQAANGDWVQVFVQAVD